MRSVVPDFGAVQDGSGISLALSDRATVRYSQLIRSVGSVAAAGPFAADGSAVGFILTYL